SKNRTKIFKDAESSRLLLETDSPFLWGSGRNEPANVLEAYQALAEARGLGLNEAEKAIESNFKFVFGV
ncbi:MAG: TatD family hydrolase, partial [Candidatus Micrarchaeota archaeon]